MRLVSVCHKYISIKLILLDQSMFYITGKGIVQELKSSLTT